MNQTQAILFSAHWEIYQKIIACNYMLHKEFAAYTAQIFSATDSRKELRLLDLGCGDAQLIAKQLQLQASVNYTGCDLSETALEYAAKFLSATKHPFVLEQGPMELMIRNSPGEYDIIYCSYAMHHLSDKSKQDLLQDCYNKLQLKGKLILIDVFRQQDQSREQYTDSYIDWMNESWHALGADEKLLIAEHIRQYDFPALYNDVVKWALLTGFKIQPFHADDSRHQMLVFEK